MSAHPFATRNGLGGFSEIAAGLNRHDKPVQNSDVIGSLLGLHGVALVMAM